MKKLFINEWTKIKYSRLLWILFAGILALVLVMGMGVQGMADRGFWYVGVTSSFEFMSTCASMVMMLLAPVAGIFFTQELQDGTMHNTLSCGISRSQYFAVKAICTIVSGLGIYLATVLLYFLTRTICAGYAPLPGTYPDCGPAIAVVYQLNCCIQVLTYLTSFLLVSVLAKRTYIVNLAGLVIWSGESILTFSVSFWKGPLNSILVSHDLWTEGRVFTVDFLRQSLFCLGLSIVFLALSYLVFIKRDIN